MKAEEGRIQFLIKGLIAWIFLSKVSFGSFIPFMPKEFSFIIFQKGFHPFLNIAFCALLGFPLMLFYLKVKDKNHLSSFYLIFLTLLAAILSLQTGLQIFYVNFDESVFLQISALLSSFFMIAIYGWIIPSLWTQERIIQSISRWAGVLTLLSLLLFLVVPGATFKGGRFIGIFKHIPHMVTCATVAFIFYLLPAKKELKHKIWKFVVLLASFAVIVLTGTRSSAAAALLAMGLSFVLFESKSNGQRFQKLSFFLVLATTSLLFGRDIFEYGRGVMMGEKAMMMREAQDGVASRMDEFERGLQMFEEHPWLGQGLISKFASGNEVDVSNYNAMKDPHNIFVSAGVIGGWPLLALSIVSLVLMLIGALKSLMIKDPYRNLLAIYLASHIPILIIYHLHLSLGGMADRIYWLTFGFLAITAQKVGTLTEEN